MIYRKYKDKDLSGLGFGCMRLPVIDGNDTMIDEAAALEMIDYAMAHGINYFDTAWGYHDGNSELVVGKGLSKYPREDFYLADKFPGYDLSNMPKVKEIFEKQLEKTRVEYFDFYLVHNVCELNVEQYIDPQYGIHDYLVEQVKNGRIRHLGFSCHGNFETYQKFMDVYGDDMEFCQLQLNWLDWKFQKAEDKVIDLRKRGIPVWVMEPLRGGKLCSLEEKYEEKLKALRPDTTTTQWAFRFLQTLPEVKMVLSGMSSLEQMKQNIDTWNTDAPLNEEERNTLQEIADEMTGQGRVMCTACHYCTSHCPMELDIPWLIELYNEHKFSDGGFIPMMGVSALDKDKRPSACLHCHSCEQVCPQQIKISDVMQDFDERLHAGA